MHNSQIPEVAMRVIRARSNGLSLYPTLDATKTALVVVDMQNAFLQPGMLLEVPIAREIVPNINHLARALRTAGGRVVWLRATMAGQRQAWSVWFDHLVTRSAADECEAVLTPGHQGFELYGALDVRSADLIVDKKRFSPFNPGSSELDAQLRALGIDSLIITGTLTNNCCECTARDAMMLNYKVVFVSDATATRTDEEHNATLGNIARVVGEVATTEQAIGKLPVPVSGRPAAITA